MPGKTAMIPAINDKRVLTSLPLILYSRENKNLQLEDGKVGTKTMESLELF